MLVPWTVLFVYSFFSFIFGQYGLYARKHLESEHVRLLENQIKLENDNRDILNAKNNLMHDPDALSVYTRQLGYGETDEKFIRILGLNVAVNTTIPAKQVFYAVDRDYIHDSIIKVISACFGLAVLVLFVIRHFLNKEM